MSTEKRKRGFVFEPDVVGALFHKYQKAQHISNTELGKMVGQSPNAVTNQYERGTWSGKTMKKYAKALGVPAEELGKAILY